MDIDMNLRALVGSGDRIGLVTLPFLVVGVFLNIAFPAVFMVGGPGSACSRCSFCWSESSIGGGVCTSSWPRCRAAS
jgi:hypothetical protein